MRTDVSSLDKVIRILVGRNPANIAYFDRKLCELPNDIDPQAGTQILSSIIPSLRYIKGTFTRLDKGFFYIAMCGERTEAIVNECFGPLCRNKMITEDQEVGTLNKLIKISEYGVDASMFASIYETICKLNVPIVACIDTVLQLAQTYKQLTGLVITKIVHPLAKIGVFNKATCLRINAWVSTMFAIINIYVKDDTRTIDIIASFRYHPWLDIVKVFDEIETDLSSFTSLVDDYLYCRSTILPKCTQISKMAAYFTVIHTGIRFSFAASVLAQLSSKTLAPLNNPTPYYPITIPIQKEQHIVANNRHPEVFRKLAIVYEKAKTDQLDLAPTMQNIASQIAVLTNQLPKLPEKAQAPQTTLLDKLILAHSLLNQHKRQTPPYMTSIVIFSLIGTYNKKLSGIASIAGELLFRDLLATPSRVDIIQQLDDFGYFTSVFSKKHVMAIIEVLSDFLDDELDSAMTVLWPTGEPPSPNLQPFLADHKCWLAIANTYPEQQSRRKHFRQMIATVIRNFWNFKALQDEINGEEYNATCRLDLVPSRSTIDGFFGEIGGTCLSGCYTEILRDDFICVRIINRSRKRWDGVIHVLLVTYQGKPAIMLAGVEPRMTIANQVDNGQFWQMIKAWTTIFAKHMSCFWVLQTTNRIALSNRPELERIIKADISSRTNVRTDKCVMFPENTYDMSDCVVLDEVQ